MFFLFLAETERKNEQNETSMGDDCWYFSVKENLHKTLAKIGIENIKA